MMDTIQRNRLGYGLYENSLVAQRRRHDIAPGIYQIAGVAAFCTDSGTERIRLCLKGSISPFNGRGAPLPIGTPDMLVPHDPLADALWAITGANSTRSQRDNLTVQDAWVVEIGEGGKVLGLARATALFGLGVHSTYVRQSRTPDHEVYTVEEMRRKGHRY